MKSGGVLCCKITLNSFGSHVSLHPGDWKEKKRHVVTGIVQRSEAPNLYSIIEKGPLSMQKIEGEAMK